MWKGLCLLHETPARAEVAELCSGCQRPHNWDFLQLINQELNGLLRRCALL